MEPEEQKLWKLKVSMAANSSSTSPVSSHYSCVPIQGPTPSEDVKAEPK